MISYRTLILTLGPILIVSVCYWVALPGAEGGLPRAEFQQPLERPVPQRTAGRDGSISLLRACEQKAEELRSRLGPQCRILIRAPYVLAGELSEAELERHYLETIVPTERALSICYFDKSPDEPISIIMLSSDESYQEYAEKFDGHERAAYHGYYQRSDRRIVLNIATGNGTLAHELTHALAHFDFPRIPEWFDEGLASLHEHSAFSEDGRTLIGLSNWRLNYLVLAIREGNLRSLESLLSTAAVRRGEEAVDYAHARYLCLYLQEQGLLSHFYRKFRAHVDTDPAGMGTLCYLLDTESLASIDVDFGRWILDQSRNR